MIILCKAFITWRWFVVWRRNFLVWLKLFGPAMLGNFGEPLLYLLGLGYGLGYFVGEINGMPYLMFLASGIVCSSAMQTATFEGMYSAYTRMENQRTWQAMLAAPLDIADIVWGEALWAASKSLFSVAPIVLIAALLGVVADWRALWVLPLSLLLGLCFAGPALIMTALARGYDFFLYYVTLIVTPLMLLSGVFFPLENLPPLIQNLAYLLPLSHAVELARPLMSGSTPTQIFLHLGVILGYTLAGLFTAAHLLQRRLQC
jgi:lipooligosaccharide transport system permease protein